MTVPELAGYFLPVSDRWDSDSVRSVATGPFKVILPTLREQIAFPDRLHCLSLRIEVHTKRKLPKLLIAANAAYETKPAFESRSALKNEATVFEQRSTPATTGTVDESTGKARHGHANIAAKISRGRAVYALGG